MKKTPLYKYLISLIVTIALFSCSTEKNTFVNRNFHKLTAHYNVYFNGNEAMKAGLYQIETEVEEDYTKILPIYKETLPGTEDMVSTDMETAIEKGEKLIKYHSITNPPEKYKKHKNKRKEIKPEYNTWVDDAYMMMGKAYLYQKNYIMAISTFMQVIRKYKDQPEKYNAYVWLLRSYSEAERYTEAHELLESLEGNDQFPEKLEGELAINAAELNLLQEHFEEAIQFLNIGIKKIKGNKRKARYCFILGQLYQETDNKQLALDAYKQVIRRRPDYTMMFNAQINSARAYSGDANIAYLRKELSKMSKKKRNEPYLDQIYYALGNLDYNAGLTDDAINCYRKSAAISENNTYQRALSCLTLGDIYFDELEYIPSGLYYDSAMAIITDAYPNYKAIKEKYTNLNNLVTNLLEVQKQDSLQALAALSPVILDSKINKWIAEEKAKIQAEEEYSQTYNGTTSRNLNNTKNKSGWYFYTQSTVSYGKKEFQRLWGNRKNEDNWRRADKTEVLVDESGEVIVDTTQVVEEEPQLSDKTTKEYYLQDIPNTDELMAQSHQKIKDALFNAGNIFKTDFNDIERSIECFNELNRRYPQNEYELPSFFSLWDSYKITEKPDTSLIYKNRILEEYPNSNYAKYLINPNFFIEEEAKKDSINKLYNMAFYDYKNGKLNAANKKLELAKTMNPDSLLKPKIAFLDLLSDSKNKKQKTLANSLKDYVKEYPESEASKLANQLITLVEEEKLTQNNYSELINTGYLSDIIKNLELLPQQSKSEEELALSKWSDESDLLHYFIIAIPNDNKIDVNRLKFDIANYNIDNYTIIDFDIETEKLNNDTKLIIVRNFNEKESALIYFLSIIRKPEVFKTLAGVKFLNFIISNKNYREMLSSRSYDDYLRFFVKNYSSFTSGEFLDEELESPEELMAKLNKEEEVSEKGKYVEVNTNDIDYTPKEEIFKCDYNTSHQIMVFIKEQRFRTGTLMRNFVKYNSSNHRQKRLRTIPGNLQNESFMLISSFETAWDAKQYLKEISENKDLFKALNDVEYETYIISQNNLDKLKETNNVEEWDKFYKSYFVYRQPPKPQSQEVETEKPIEETTKEVESTNEKTTQTEQDTTTSKEANNTKEEVTPKVQDSSENVENEEAAPSEKQETVSETTQEENVQEATEEVDEENTSTTENTEDSVVQETVVKTAEEDAFSSPYTFEPNAKHNVIYLLPIDGSNTALVTTYLTRFNAMKHRSLGLKVTTQDFDDIRSVVIVSGLRSKEKAEEYFKETEADSRIKMSLQSSNYKAYIITNDNFEVLKTSKDIPEYKKFYEKFYTK